MEGESSRDEIEEIMKLTNSTREQAHFFLEASGGDFDSAVIMFMGKPEDMAKCMASIKILETAHPHLCQSALIPNCTNDRTLVQMQGFRAKASCLTGKIVVGNSAQA